MEADINAAVPNSEEEAIFALELKKAFARARTDKDSKPFRLNPRYDDPVVWLKMARNCMACKASPYDFIQACMTHCPSVPGGPFPNMFSGVVTQTWYSKYAKEFLEGKQNESETSMHVAIRSQMHAILRLWGSEYRQKMSLAEFLLDDLLLPEYRFPPLIRVLLMPKQPEVLERFHDAAKLDYDHNPVIRQAIADLGLDSSWVEYKTQKQMMHDERIQSILHRPKQGPCG